MAKFLVQKSAPLHGEVKISGSKNAVLPIMAAALLTEEKCEIKDVPALRDVQVMCKLLESLGATVDPELDENNVDITAGSVLTYEAPYGEDDAGVDPGAGSSALENGSRSDPPSWRMCYWQAAGGTSSEGS